MHTRTHTNTHTHTPHTHTHAHMHRHTRTHAHTHTHTCTHTHTHTHARTHAPTHARTHAHTHTHSIISTGFYYCLLKTKTITKQFNYLKNKIKPNYLNTILLVARAKLPFRPWAKNSSPNTNDLYIHYMDKSTGTPSLEEKALPNCGNKDGNIIQVLKTCISTSVATVLKCMKWLNTYVQVISVCWWVCGSFKVTAEVFSCFLQTSQVLPHGLNHHFSLILVLYTETLSW